MDKLKPCPFCGGKQADMKTTAVRSFMFNAVFAVALQF